MRLIDGTALYMHLNNWALAEAPTELDVGEMKFEREVIYKTILDCITIVDEQPTVFDVDNVVEELIDERWSDKCCGCKLLPSFCGKAIDIVKRGGVDDK